MTQKEINKAIREYKDFQLMKKSVEKEMERLKEKLTKHMDAKQIEVLEAEEGKVISRLNVSNVFNQDLFKSQHEKLFEKYKTPIERPYFKVS